MTFRVCRSQKIQDFLEKEDKDKESCNGVGAENKKDEQEVALDGCEDMRESLFFLAFLEIII